MAKPVIVTLTPGLRATADGTARVYPLAADEKWCGFRLTSSVANQAVRRMQL